jgi:small GTP-binding protein
MPSVNIDLLNLLITINRIPILNMKPNINIVKKICLLGEPYVGKTSLIERYVLNTYSDGYLPTIGSKVVKKTLVMDFEPKRSQSINLTLLIFDLIGHLEFMKVLQTYFMGAEGALIVGDLTREKTLGSMSEWHDRFREVVGEVPVIYLGNKSDLIDKSLWAQTILKKVATNYESEHAFTSAKSGENVEWAFYRLARNILDRGYRKASSDVRGPDASDYQVTKAYY